MCFTTDLYRKGTFSKLVTNFFSFFRFTTDFYMKGIFSDLFTNFFSICVLPPICTEKSMFSDLSKNFFSYYYRFVQKRYFQWPVYKIFHFLCFTTDLYIIGTFSDLSTNFFNFCDLPPICTEKVLSVTCLQTFSFFLLYHRFVQKRYFQWPV